MRPPTLQYFYLENPMLLLIAISMICILPWIGQGDFSASEWNEVAGANSILTENQWLVPKIDVKENIYKSPLISWCIAVFSLPGGEVTPLTARIPSVISFICLLCFSFIFFGKNLRFQDAFLSALIMLTAFFLHRESMSAGRDMTFAFFVVLGLQRLFRWEERKALHSIPLTVILCLSLAGLTKGFIGVFLPLLIFAVYLFLLKYRIKKIVTKIIPVLIFSSLLPLAWNIIAFLQTGENKLTFDIANHLRPLYSHSLIIGFMPWTLLMFMSLFGLKYRYLGKRTFWQRISGMDRIKLFSLITIIVLILFILPKNPFNLNLIIIYPFIAVFMAEYVLYLTEYRIKTSRLFAFIIGLAGIGLVLFWIASLFGLNSVYIPEIQPIRIYHFVSIALLVFGITLLMRHLWKKNHLKVLYFAIGVYLAMQLVVDGIFLYSF
ncbi:MAG: hypothetical protein LBH12_04270 [Dysgonamonadaceae bacterium]|jgi:4-amino-4-deoxy-L-arabinose transferase-like glycosyltransferase|nr:hypothetical protein [Dysgonamonadaceae bacterium]